MAYSDINSEDRLVQATFAEHLEQQLGWESVTAWNQETFGAGGTLGRADTREVVLVRDLRAALARLNPELPAGAVDDAVAQLTRHDHTRSLVQHNSSFHRFLRDGVPVRWRDAAGQDRQIQARVIDFREPLNNRFLAVRELKITGLRTPNYNRRADLVCFVNGLPLVFIELKAVYLNIRAAYDGNLKDYLDENVIAHAFHHNAFIVVSNGSAARYGSITSGWDHYAEWKRLNEDDKGSVAAEVLLDGMLARSRLLDLLEHFILFDESRAGAVRKVVARNHQVLGVNRAVAAVLRQEALKAEFPPAQRLRYRVVSIPLAGPADSDVEATQGAANDAALGALHAAEPPARGQASQPGREVTVIERAHPELGRLGVLWHTQGSGKSYSMLFFAEKVRRTVPGNFTFVMMTDRHDLDTQIYKTFVGCGVADDATPRAQTGPELRALLKQNHRFIFSLIHKFNQDVDPGEPYSERDDIIVVSDEAHRTQSGRLARNMRLALPNAAFIGFTGTPLFKNDQITKRIFGGYVSRYDFKRSEEDGATVRLVYENRGEKLGVARQDLNDRIATAIEQADLDPDQKAKVEKLLGKDYEVITADDRLEKIAVDFVDHCAKRWEAGKAMLVCIDKETCGRMVKLIGPHWLAKAAQVRQAAQQRLADIDAATDADLRQQLHAQRDRLLAQATWLDDTIIGLIVSEAQGEVAAFKRWEVDIIPHRALMKQGFETADGQRVDVETAFKRPSHPFRVAVVCAMWLTGFDVECLSTLYIDKPMKAHTLMQAIARANRRYPGKDFGLVVDYNGMLASLRAALAMYALGDDAAGSPDIVAPLQERVRGLDEALLAVEDFLRLLGFEPDRLTGAKGWARVAALADAVEAIHAAGQPGSTTPATPPQANGAVPGADHARQRFEILARAVFQRFKSLVTEPTLALYAERHDNIEAVYKKLEERRDSADISGLMKALHRIVNEAIEAHAPGADQVQALTVDLSQIDLEALRDEFAKKVKRKATVIEDIRQLLERKLALLLAKNPTRMDFDIRYREIVAQYNLDKDRATVEETFARLTALLRGMDDEQRRAAREGLSEEELAVFDLLAKEAMTTAERERVKQSSRELLAELQRIIAPLDQWTEKEQTRAEVEAFILDQVFMLPEPPFSPQDKDVAAKVLFEHVWQQSMSGQFGAPAPSSGAVN